MSGQDMNPRTSRHGDKFRKWSRNIHRDLSFFFAGVIVIYAVSGIMLNHKRDFNSYYSLKTVELVLEGEFPYSGIPGRGTLKSFVSQLPESEAYTRHSLAGDTRLKIFFKGGSSLEVDLLTGHASYEKVRKRPLTGAFNRLHYNPSRAWTWFSDLFAVSLLVITVSGLVMLKGRRGIWGRGGIEFLIGASVPMIFMLLT